MMNKSEIPYRVYSAGGLFTQHELTTNVLIKQAVWEGSKGKFELVLPQSKELRDSERPDIAAYIRNTDLLQVVKCDLMLARFDGVELDTGTVVEYMLAKFLGKPTVILRCDSRRLGSEHMDEPYNLMIKNWPRTVEVHSDSLIHYTRAILDVRETNERGEAYQKTIENELKSVQRGVRNLAEKIVDGLEKVVLIPSPYPPEYREAVYWQVRFMAGGGFEDLLTESLLEEIIEVLRGKDIL